MLTLILLITVGMKVFVSITSNPKAITSEGLLPWIGSVVVVQLGPLPCWGYGQDNTDLTYGDILLDNELAKATKTLETMRLRLK